MNFLHKIDPEMIPNAKVGAHSFQIIFVFIIFCMEIVVIRGKDSHVNGNVGWPFAVCFLTVPAWIYLIMTPRWPRTLKYAEPHAMLTIDAIFTVFWLSAFAAQAKYNSDNDCGDVCGISKGVVGLGVFVFLFFIVSTFISVYTLNHYSFHGQLPGYEKNKLKQVPNNDPDKQAFNSALGPEHDDPFMRTDHDDPEAAAGFNTGYGGSTASRYEDNRYAGPHVEGPDDFDSYGGGRRQDPVGYEDTTYGRPADTAYGGAPAGPAFPPAGSGPYDDGPARFPSANYGI